jgi:hypothetical protein
MRPRHCPGDKAIRIIHSHCTPSLFFAIAPTNRVLAAIIWSNGTSPDQGVDIPHIL